MNNLLKQYKSILLRTLLLSVLFITSCGSDENIVETEPNNEVTKITSFSFLKANNANLPYDIYLDINDTNISGRIPVNTDIKNLIATFEHEGSEVFANNIKQNSGISSINFTPLVTYTVNTSDNRQENYTVNLTKFTGLPIVYINTDGAVPIDSKDDYRTGKITIEGGKNYDDLAETTMKIRGRGNSTWWIHPKKPYQLKFNSETNVLGLPLDKTWIFLAEYSDKTMLRNTIAFEMGYLSALEWTPKSVFSEVYINNKYNGTYNITQKVEKTANRVNLGTTGYLLEIDQLDRLDPDDVYFRTADFLINIKEPSVDYGTSNYTLIKDLINEFETVLKSSQFKDPINGYQKYIDVDTFVDWYLISEITKNQDSRSYSSIYFNVIPGQKIKMGPLWDFDLAFGNVDYSDCTHPTGFWVKYNPWYSRLFQDPAFVAKVKTRFSYFRANQDLILNKMDSHANYLKWAQQENNAKWNTIGIKVWPNPVWFNTYDGEVEHLKSWYRQRMSWLETAIYNL